MERLHLTYRLEQVNAKLIFLVLGIAAGFRNIGHAIRKSRNL